MDVISDLILKVKRDAVYCKGPEKAKCLRTWLPHIEEMTWIATSFKKLYNCTGEVCAIKHGLNCARRNVHEFHYIDVVLK